MHSKHYIPKKRTQLSSDKTFSKVCATTRLFSFGGSDDIFLLRLLFSLVRAFSLAFSSLDISCLYSSSRKSCTGCITVSSFVRRKLCSRTHVAMTRLMNCRLWERIGLRRTRNLPFSRPKRDSTTILALDCR